jgi:hypothetical protein
MEVALNRYQWIVFLVMPLILSWPAWVNGQPFFFPDTTAYIKGAASAAELLLKTETADLWLGKRKNLIAASVEATQKEVTLTESPEQKYSSSPDKGGVLAGRSIYYGLFVFVIISVFGLKFVPVIQALISISVIVTCLRSKLYISYQKITAALLFLAVASPLPYFNSILMPDIFASLGISSAIALILIPTAPILFKLLWSVVLLSASLFHSANIPIILVSAFFLMALIIIFKKYIPFRSRLVAVTFFMVFLGIVGEILFGFAIKHYTHASPIRPPFITARLVADGPGNEFISKNCKQSTFEICRYQRDFTKATSDDFLWSLDPSIGVFTLASRNSREKLGNQDFTFARAVLEEYPLPVLIKISKNILRQTTYIGLEEFSYNQGAVDGFSKKLPSAELESMKKTLAAQGKFNTHYSTQIFKIISGISLMICIFAAAFSFKKKKYVEFIFAIIFPVSIFINAAICGGLSTPHDRYQARVIWLIELLALLILALKLGIVKKRTSDSVKVLSGSCQDPVAGYHQ